MITKCSTFIFGGVIEVGPQRACGFTCVILVGTSKGLTVQEFLRELIVSVAAPSDLTGSF